MIQNDEGNLTILDVRTPQEYKKDGRIANAKIIPLGYLGNNLKMLDKSKTILVYCRSGSRSVSASRTLSDNGFTAINMSGGLLEWQSEKLPVE
jgi:rhodanese-related sulfurtransferase